MAAHQLRLGALRRQVALAAALALALPAAVAVASAAELPLRGTAQGEAGSPSPSLRLDPLQPRLSGYAGCNRISGAFEIDGARLVVSRLVSTRRVCVPDDGAEQRFLQAQAGVRHWRIEGGALLLLSAAGAPRLTLRAAPERP